ncbi:receptor-like protein 9DC3 [Camellia sinensis]|uniref:receptor-like protein 9DC3 n=1 Tax=Camellia sinensis TaxID=4442 RepID=UPI00103596AC|nr:receptor-like protein 9DC3 [Camellia sinensis]
MESINVVIDDIGSPTSATNEEEDGEPSILVTEPQSQRVAEVQAHCLSILTVQSMDTMLHDILIVKEFPDVFPKELPRKLVDREIEFTIEVMPGTQPILKTLYRMSTAEMKELKVMFLGHVINKNGILVDPQKIESTALLQFKQLFSVDCSNVSDGCYPRNNNWKEGTDCCAWDGVTCDYTTAHVIELDLGCECLYGTIHPNSSLFNLVHLQHLDLSWNNFNHSKILPSFGRFTNLTVLKVQDSHLSGPIQSSKEEVWQGNNFSNSIFHLQKLQELSLASNRKLTNKIPSFINGTLRHLRLLYLYETGFAGELPNSIGQLECLEELDLHDCNFSGTIPRFPKNLYSLDLSHNNFEGPIPPFSIFSQLSYINFSNNQLTGPIPPSSLFHLVNLNRLDLSSNNLSGTVELDMSAKLEYLEYLDLSNSGLSLTTTNSTPSSFRYIEILRLSSCNISKIPEFLKTQKEALDVLDLSNNRLNELNPLCNLDPRYLDLSNNQFAGLIPTCFANLTGLRFLNLQRNNFHGSIPQTFGYASMLEDLDISHNGLQGVLPRSLTNCTNLEILNLGHNLIEDTFPFWLEKLPKLKVIVLQDNKFHGPIEQPGKRLAFTNLHIVDISHNDFIGTLPSKYFESMHSMMIDDKDKSVLNYMGYDFGYYSVTIMNKGLEITRHKTPRSLERQTARSSEGLKTWAYNPSITYR